MTKCEKNIAKAELRIIKRYRRMFHAQIHK
jgi:hypothetical protein